MFTWKVILVQSYSREWILEGANKDFWGFEATLFSDTRQIFFEDIVVSQLKSYNV